jgi:hypothetical protein
MGIARMLQRELLYWNCCCRANDSEMNFIIVFLKINMHVMAAITELEKMLAGELL